MNGSQLPASKARWDDIDGYELYVGRWSKLISEDFIKWLDPRQTQNWLEIGCGTGAFTKAITMQCAPAHLLAIDKSEAYLQKAKEKIGVNDKVAFQNADLKSFQTSETFDYITSGLVLNFIPDIEGSLRSLLTNLNSGGRLSAYVWDYGGHYQPMRLFWDTAREVVEGVDKYDPGIIFELCREKNLTHLFESLGLSNIRFSTIERIATFQSFDDYWLPISTAQGSVTTFFTSLSDAEKEELRARLQKKLPAALNGEIKLVISVLAISGTAN